MRFNCAVVGCCALVLSACVNPNMHQQTPLDVNSAALSAPPDLSFEASAESEVIYHYLMGQVAGIHSSLAEQEGDTDTEMALINVAIPNLVRANEYMNDAELAEQTAKTALFVKRYDEASASANQWIALQPLRSKPYQMAAFIAMQQQNFERASAYLTQVISLENNQQKGEETVATFLGSIKNTDDVLAVTDLLALESPNSVMPPLVAAHALYKNKQYAKSLPYLDKVLTSHPNSERAVLLKAETLAQSGALESAMRFLENQVKRNPSNKMFRTGYAESLFELKQFDKAIKQYQILLAQNKNDASLLMRMAQLRLEQDKPEQAVVYLNRILKNRAQESSSVVSSVYYRLGMANEMQEKWQQAMQAYTQLRNMKDADPWLQDTALVRMVAIDLQRKKYASAKQTMDVLERVLNVWKAKDRKNRPTRFEDGSDPVEQLDIEFYMLKTEWLSRQEAFEDAHRVVNEGLNQYPDNFELRYSRSLVAEQAGYVEEAIKDLEQLLTQSPDNANVKNALGYTLTNSTQEYDRAYDLIKSALDELPDNPAVLDSMGWVLFKLGQFNEAEQYLRKAYAEVQDPEISAHLFEVLWQQNKQDEANKVLNHALRKYPNNKMLKKTKARLVQ